MIRWRDGTLIWLGWCIGAVLWTAGAWCLWWLFTDGADWLFTRGWI